MSMTTEEENDMPSVLPEGHELVAAVERLEMSNREEVARRKRVDDCFDHMERTLASQINILSDSNTFKVSMFSTPEDRHTMSIVQGTMLQHTGITLDMVKQLRPAVYAISEANRQMGRNTAGILALAVGTYVQREVPEQDLSIPDTLPPIDLANPLLPRDTRLYENRNVPRSPENPAPRFNDGDRDNVMYDPNGSLQMGSM